MSDKPAPGRTPDEVAAGLAPTVTPTEIAETVSLEPPGPARVSDEELELTGEPRYLPRGQIGAGGMGEVTLDLDRRIGREVAVKRLRAKLLDSAEARERFLHEARVQGQLEHPAIVPVYDLREDDDGHLAFTMRRVRGDTLRDILEARALSSEDAIGTHQLLAAWRQICLAIDYAHSRGVIHRDLKPENVMLGDFGEVYVLDWGIARVAGAADAAERAVAEDAADGATVRSGRSTSTRHGAMLGTPGYMPPEQLAGELDRLDGRADVYALGALLFEILTGTLLHEGHTLDDLRESYAADPEDRIIAICAAHDVAPELADLCVRATRIDPEERVASARALSDAVERYLEGDRDLRMRRTKAEEHADAAAVAAKTAFDEDEATQRSTAAREAGRALALDPQHRGARRTLLELLTRPPRRTPVAVNDRIAESAGQQLVAYYRGSLLMIMLYVPLLALAAVLENIERWPVPLAIACAVVGTSVCVHGLRKPQPREDWRPFLVLLSVSVALCAATRIVGPLIFVPLLAGLNTVVTMLFPGRAPRWLIALAGTCPVMVMMLLEASGLLPTTTSLSDGVLQIVPRALALNGWWPLPLLTVVSTLPPIFTTVVVGWCNDRTRESDRQLALQRWQLEQLLPSEAG
jgi:tRNA A-37 threonylcarbamoyl transferase component Bud32